MPQLKQLEALSEKLQAQIQGDVILIHCGRRMGMASLYLLFPWAC